MTFLTLGFGLFINLDASSGWAKIIIYQIIAGVGAGANIQSPLIALQTLTPAQDNATATSTFGFVRGLALAISIVLGGVVFQNGMESQAGELRAQLGDSVAALLSGSKAGANIIVIDSLGPVQQKVARLAFAWALKRMWILYTCTAAAGLVASFFVGRQELSRVHEEVRTGLQESSTTALMEKQQ